MCHLQQVARARPELWTSKIENVLITRTGGCHGTPRPVDALWGWLVVEDVVVVVVVAAAAAAVAVAVVAPAAV